MKNSQAQNTTASDVKNTTASGVKDHTSSEQPAQQQTSQQSCSSDQVSQDQTPLEPVAADSISPESIETLVAEYQALQEKVVQLEEESGRAKDLAQRSLADYQNLIRRSREEKMKFAKMANQELLEALVQPLDHLSMAAQQLNDSGLTMVVQQFSRALEQFDFKEIDAMGKPFDVELMEVVEKKGKGEKVVEVVRKGYTLGGEVIQHAKVILG